MDSCFPWPLVEAVGVVVERWIAVALLQTDSSPWAGLATVMVRTAAVHLDCHSCRCSAELVGQRDLWIVDSSGRSRVAETASGP